ncbi:hypothetical protein AQUCO_05500023v1 [Aquilegia coerulea]|uniref:Uncharacterized protein n=1 Tax=Aquilegia coerulea TaxID=218851 RepID=A0A2G5CGM4_AQUCA|nr:hypothetical protein AQUCO_05500023v1 [Aquilegia coerulea]
MELNAEIDERTENSNDISIETDDDDDSSILAAHILAAIPPKPSSISFIYRVPDNLRVGSEYRYEPKVASIGPYHCGKKNLKVTEKHKLWYLWDLLSRSTPPKTTMKNMVKAIKSIEVQARECYAEEINLTSDEFVMMMIVDGCFILELLYRYEEYTKRLKERVDDNDLIFSANWLVRTVQRDLVLLENQLPFVVLDTLFNFTWDPKHNISLNKLVLQFLELELPTSLIRSDDNIVGKHILDLLRNYLLPPSDVIEYEDEPTWQFAYNSATVLWEIGVKFKVKKIAKGFADITFSEDGVLEIPHFHVGEGMSVLIPNLVALEQCHQYFRNIITSYALFLEILIRSKDDVKLLRSGNIITVPWNRDEEIVTKLSNLVKGAKFDHFYYDGLCTRISLYTRRHKWRAIRYKWNVILKRDYFGSPWAVLSFVAAILLLVLTLTQTIYAVRSYPPRG